MIIDIHNHLGEPWGTRYRQTPDELLARMDRAGVDVAGVMPFPFNNFDNDYVVRAVAAHPERFVGLVLVSPFQEEDPRDTIRRLVEVNGFRGVKLHPAAHGYKLSEHAVVQEILDLCAELELPVLAYSGDELYATPFQVQMAAQRHPDVDFIMAHSGFMMQTNDAIMVAEVCPNVYLEHSSGVSSGVVDSAHVLGAGRLVLGSDTPHMDFEVEIFKIRLCIPDPSDQDQVLGGTARRLLRI